MPQIFHRSANTLSKLSLAGLLIVVGSLIFTAILVARSDYVTRAHEFVEQPVQFSHRHHVMDDGIDCRYCHTSVETSPFAGIPPTKTCMNCHSQIWNQAPILEPIRASFQGRQAGALGARARPAGFVYSTTAIHVNKGWAARRVTAASTKCRSRSRRTRCDGVVPQLPSQPGAVRAAARRDLHDGLQPPVPQSVMGPQLDEGVRHPAGRRKHQLLDVPPVTRS